MKHRNCASSNRTLPTDICITGPSSRASFLGGRVQPPALILSHCATECGLQPVVQIQCNITKEYNKYYKIIKYNFISFLFFCINFVRQTAWDFYDFFHDFSYSNYLKYLFLCKMVHFIICIRFSCLAKRLTKAARLVGADDGIHS